LDLEQIIHTKTDLQGGDVLYKLFSNRIFFFNVGHGFALKMVGWSQDSSIWSCCSQSRQALLTVPMSQSCFGRNCSGMLGLTKKCCKHCVVMTGSTC